MVKLSSLVFAFCHLLYYCSSAEISITFRDAEPLSSDEIQDKSSNPFTDLGALSRNIFLLANKFRSDIRTSTGFTRQHSTHTHSKELHNADLSIDQAKTQGLSEAEKKECIPWVVRVRGDEVLYTSDKDDVEKIYKQSQEMSMPYTYSQYKTDYSLDEMSQYTLPHNSVPVIPLQHFNKGNAARLPVTVGQLAVEPFHTIGIVTHDKGFCTGTFIGPWHVLTSADCLFALNGWSENILFTPGKHCDASAEMQIVYEWKRMIVPAQWMLTKDKQFNYGMIVVKPLATTHKFMDFTWYDTNLFHDNAVNAVFMIGYPVGDQRWCMWLDFCHLLTNNDEDLNLFMHDCISSDIGAPIFSPHHLPLEHPAISCIDNHWTVGADGKRQQYCLRITKTIFFTLAYWIDKY